MTQNYYHTELYQIEYIDIEYRDGKTVCGVYLGNFASGPGRIVLRVSISNFPKLCKEFEAYTGARMHHMPVRCYVKDDKIKYIGSLYRDDKDTELIPCKEVFNNEFVAR